MSTKIPVLPMVLDLPWALCTRFVHPPSARPFSAKSFHLSLSLFLGSPKMGKKCFQVKCLPDELFDETKDGRSDSLRVALNEIERTLVKRIGSAALAVIKRHAIDQTRR